jgi:DNA invertase Pin-like site-specific DNA recombinase
MKAVLYARVSSKEQEKEGYSIPAQLKLLKDYARKHNFKIIQEFIDVETAKRAGRTDFNQMIEFFQSNKDIRILLCEKTDRLYRNFKDYVNLEEFDLAIHLVKENEVLSKESKSHQKFIHGIKVLMAKNYIDNLSEETKKGMLQKAHEGYYPSFAPLGYFNVEKNINGRKIKAISIDKSRSYIIQKMFKLYANRNYSLQQITEFANQEGLRSRKGYKIYKSTTHKILRDPIYYGNFIWKGELCKGKHQPIISKELFEQVQEQLDNYNRPKQIKKHKFAFSGLLTCGKCGCAITSEIKKGKYIYYHCTGYKGKCGNKAIREEDLIEKFGEIVKKVQIDSNILNWLKEALKESHKDKKKYHDKQIENLQKQYTKYNNRLDRLYEDKLDGIITKEFFEEKNKLWSKEQQDIFSLIEKHKKANANYFEQGIKILELTQKLYSAYLQESPKEKGQLVNLLLSNCTLNDGNLYPVYKKPFNLLVKEPSRILWWRRRDSNSRPKIFQ